MGIQRKRGNEVLNKVILSGTLVRDPASNENSKAVRFTIASKRSFKDKDGNYGADFPNCVAFGKTAEFISKYFQKGSAIMVEGRINTSSYTGKDGNKVYTTDVAVDRAEFGIKATDASARENGEADSFMNLPDNASDNLPMFG